MFQRILRRLSFATLLFAGVSGAFAGSLSGSVATQSNGVTISSYGTLDWSVFGNGGVLPGRVSRSSSVGIGTTYSVIGTATPTVATDGIRSFSWSSGSPLASGSSYKNVVSVAGINNGLRVTVPADAQSRTVRIHFDLKSAGGTFRASLSDGSAPDYVNVVTSGNNARQYTITYSANGPGRTLNLDMTMTAGTGSVRLAGVSAPTFSYVNHAPTLSAPSALTVQRAQAVSVSVVGYDSDGDTLTYSATGLPPGLTIDTSTGAISGSPTTAGTYSASVTVRDTGSLTATSNITFTVASGAVNTAPSSASGSFTTSFGTATTFTPNWIDPDSGDSWAVQILTQPANGTATASGTQITYTPNTGYVGPDSFNFRVVDSYAAFTDGTVNGSVVSVTPDQVGIPTASQGTQLGSVQLSWSAAANATTYDVLRGTSASDPSPVLIGNAPGLSYSDSTAAPGAQYWYSIVSRLGGATAAPSVAVMGYADTPPSSASATFAATLETPINVNATFTDPDSGDAATFSIVTQPANGTASVASNQIVYTPNPGYVGSDSFTFSVTDRAGGSTVGTATGTVTALVPSQVTTVSATQGTLLGAVSVTWGSASNARSYRVLRGTSPTDPAPSAIATVTTLSHSDNTATPGVQYYYSVQSLSIGQQGVPSSTVLGFADTPPSSASATFAATLESPITFTPTYTDPDSGDTATFAIATQPANGTASVASNQITYTPNPGYVGPDSFTFSVTDRAGASTIGTASGTVTALTPAQVTTVTATQGTLLGAVSVTWTSAANARSYRVLRGSSPTDPAPTAVATVTTLSHSDNTAAPGAQYYYSVQSLTIGKQGVPSSTVLGFADTPPSAASASFSATLETPILVNPTFTDPDSGDTATFTIVAQPANGTASVASNQITYSPNAGYVGPDSFTFSVTDRAGASTIGTASGTVTALIPAQVSSVTATQGTLQGSVSLNWGSAANARSYRILRGSTPSDPAPTALATVTSLSYGDTSAAPGVQYYYSVQSLTIGQQGVPSSTVLGFADTPPSAASATFSTPVNTVVTFAPLFTDPDPSDTATLSIVAPPARGTALVVGGSFRYTPETDYSGPVSFTFSVTDRAGASTTGTASGSVLILTPDPISALTASQGFGINAVNLTWNSSTNATSYRVFRSVDSADPSPTQIGVVAGTNFTNSGIPAGQGYYYFVQPYNLAVPGPMSAGVYGFADTPPSAASASFSTIESQSVTFVPTWVDPDIGDYHSIAIVGQPARGIASVVGNQLVYTPTAGYVGPDSFTFSVTDKAGSSVVGSASGVVDPGVPPKPLGFVVSQGTLLGGVNLSWDVAAGSRQYLVTRSQTSNAATPPVIATVDTNSFVDTNTTPGATYYYRIRGVGVAGIGPYSEEVSGYADTTPTSATASASTIFNIPVEFRPTVVDPDPKEKHTLAITTQPANGVLTLTTDQTGFNYAPNVGFSGQDTFSFTATDVAGASVSGTGTISVGCPTPTVSSLVINQPKIFANSGFTVTASYGNTACPVALTAVFEVLNGTTVVTSQTRSDLTGAVSAPLAFNVDGLQPGTYSIRVTVTDGVTLQTVRASVSLNVPAYRMPSFTASSLAFADLDNATVAVGRSDDCSITSNRSAAIADHTLCYYEVTNIPPGLTFDSAQANPTWKGRPNLPGTYQPTLTVYQYDDTGAARQLGQVIRTTTVNPISALTFTSPSPIDAAQYIQLITINVSQTSGPNCPIITDRARALSQTLAGNRTCYVEYSPLPPRSTITPTGLTTYFLESGLTSVGWRVSTFDASGTEVRFATGSSEVNVRPVDVNFEPTWGDRNPIATVTKASVRLVNNGSDRCSGTVNPSEANVPNADKPCLIEWLTLPPGITQDPGTQQALVTGIFRDAGQIPISYRVSYYDVEGNKRILLEATKNVTVDPPPLPVFFMKTSRPIGGDRYVVPDNGGLLGILVTEPGGWPVDAQVKWSDEPATTTYRVNRTSGLQILSATPAPLWSERTVDVRLQLRDAPGLYTDKRITVHSVPPDAIRLGLDVLNADVPDSEPFPVTARISMMGTTGPYYDAATMGGWSVQFGFKDSSSQFIPQGAPVPIDAEGIARSALNPFGQTVVRVQAYAVPISTLDGYTRKLDSPLRVASVVKGTPIDATIGMFRGGTEGPAPFTAVMRVTYKTRGDQLANESVKWKRSSDGGVTWEDVVEDGPQITNRLQEGVHLYKALFVNRNTRVSSESNVLTMRAWSIPKIAVLGPSFAFPGTETTLNIALTHPSGAPVVSAETTWTVNKRVTAVPGADPPPPIATGTGTAVVFTGSDPGTYIVTVRSRMTASNPDDPRAWGTAIKSVIYGAPERPFARIVGPARVEVGKPITYELLLRTRYDLSATNLRLGGRWTLPDGTTVSSLTPHTYTATDADYAAGKFVTLKYEAWVVGYEDTTTISTTLSLPIWKYIWPNWSLTQSVVVPYAPTNSRITVVASDPTLLSTLERLTYEWTVPPTMRALTVPTNKLDTVIDYGGTHPVSVTVSDARGNRTTLNTEITVGPAAPYVINFTPTNMSSWSHAPVVVGVVPKVSGGHPMDSVTTWSYYVDGARIDLPNKNTAQIPITNPGTYNVEVRIQSKMGATATQSASVTVLPNTPATCEVVASTNTSKTAIYLKANCVDPDGAITKYQWSVNGVPQTLVAGYKWTYLVPAGTPWPIRIDLNVIDDGGGSTTSGVTVN